LEISVSDAVTEHYTAYPYPAYSQGERDGDRDYYLHHTECHRGVCRVIARNETQPRFYHHTLPLDVLNMYLFKGKQTFDDNFRVLLPGGGTGSVVVGLGEQLNHTNAELVYLDISEVSMRIAQSRSEMVGLSNITWYRNSIEDIPQLELGEFDLIECSGVLHHLPHPQHGLNILADSLADTGGMSAMVYARIGRTGVYHLQDLVRIINKGVTSREAELNNLWKILRSFDKEYLLRLIDVRLNGDQGFFLRGIFKERSDDWDVEAYDRLCHSQDRAYTATELFEFIEESGLHLVSLPGPAEKFVLSTDYQPNFGALDEKTKRHLKRLSFEEQVAIAELVDGSIDNHYFYASKQKDSEATFNDLSNIPYIYGEPRYLDIVLKSTLYDNQGKPSQPKLMFSYRLDIPRGAWQINWTVTPTVIRMIELVEGRNKNIGEIVDIIATETNKNKDDVFKDCKKFYEEVKTSNIILLKGENVPDLWKTYKRPLFSLSFP